MRSIVGSVETSNVARFFTDKHENMLYSFLVKIHHTGKLQLNSIYISFRFQPNSVNIQAKLQNRRI